MIKVNREGPLWRIVIARPQKANSLTGDMLEHLISACHEAHDKAKAVIITGRGKVFSAGADLEEARAGLATSPLWEELSAAVAGLPCLTVAALNGTLAGGAFGMALACDLRVCVPSAQFFYPVMKLGFLPQPSDPPRMAALIGIARTKMILMAGQKISAETAFSWGLVDKIVPEPDRLDDTALALCTPALGADARQIAAIKALAGRSLPEGGK